MKNKHKLTNHLMIDCETLSLETNAVIATIGAVVFRLDGEVEILDSLYLRLTLDDQVQMGRHISADTFFLNFMFCCFNVSIAIFLYCSNDAYSLWLISIPCWSYLVTSCSPTNFF